MLNQWWPVFELLLSNLASATYLLTAASPALHNPLCAFINQANVTSVLLKANKWDWIGLDGYL